MNEKEQKEKMRQFLVILDAYQVICMSPNTSLKQLGAARNEVLNLFQQLLK